MTTLLLTLLVSWQLRAPGKPVAGDGGVIADPTVIVTPVGRRTPIGADHEGGPCVWGYRWDLDGQPIADISVLSLRNGTMGIQVDPIETPGLYTVGVRTIPDTTQPGCATAQPSVRATVRLQVM